MEKSNEARPSRYVKVQTNLRSMVGCHVCCLDSCGQAQQKRSEATKRMLSAPDPVQEEREVMVVQKHVPVEQYLPGCLAVTLTKPMPSCIVGALAIWLIPPALPL